MHLAKLQSEQKIADLVNRLYQFPEASRLGRLRQLSPEEINALEQRAETALRQANPSLSALDKLPPGTVLVVPAVAGLKFAGGVQPTGTLPRDIVTQVGQDVKGAQAMLNQTLKGQLQEATDYLKALDSDEVKPLLGFAAFKAAFDQIKKEAETLVQDYDRLLRFQEQTGKRLEKDLDDLGKSFVV